MPDEKKARIIIIFESPRSALAKVEYENIDLETICPQMVMIGEFLVTQGKLMWEKGFEQKTQQQGNVQGTPPIVLPKKDFFSRG